MRGTKLGPRVDRRLPRRVRTAWRRASGRSHRILVRGASPRLVWGVTGAVVRAMAGAVGLAPLRAGVRGRGLTCATVGGRYQLLATIGCGGGGELYKANDTVLDRIVAVKLLRPGHDPAARARLRAEAHVAARLSHESIATVLDYGEDLVGGEPAPYLVMQYVEGVTLSAMLGRGPLPPARVADLIAQVAEALAVVHAGGVVHRDVKPANIMFTHAGRAVLLDFGIARRDDADPLTRTGNVVGTLNYISPEQAAGEAATPRSDLYSLGMVAYEALTGERALVRETQAETLVAHLTGVVEPLPVDLPNGALRALVDELVRRDPLERPADAGVVARRARAAAPTT